MKEPERRCCTCHDRFWRAVAQGFRACALFTTPSSKSDMATVETQLGAVRGPCCFTPDGSSYYAFKGIPYAKPPVGELRFKAPEPPERWEGVREAIEHGPVCPQYNERMDRIDLGSEDCLYLNVYTRSLNPLKPLPVMFWIHGGAFYTGSGNSDFYGPEFFMENDVILVTINYRLEVFGFLCLNNEEVPGNAGLKDQVMALKWVKNNIKAFGGDPNNVTIFGCSAGAACTSLHLVSQMSRGLFHKAICQSGICLHEWSYMPPESGLEKAFQLAKLLGKETEDPKELLEFLRHVPPASLINVKLPMSISASSDITDSIVFRPVIENSKLKVDIFITECPTNLVRKGQTADVPLMLGCTSGEGIEIVRNYQQILPFLAMPGAVVPKELKLKFSPEKVMEFDIKIRQKYFDGKQITMEKLKEGAKLETDKLFRYNIRRFARYHVLQHRSPVYTYKFTPETERNYTKKSYNIDDIDGVCHADDLYYLFNVTCLPVPLTDDTRKLIQKIVRLWTDFATNGSPTAPQASEQWLPFTESEQHWFIIGKSFQCATDEDIQSMIFWDDIYGEINVDTIS